MFATDSRYSGLVPTTATAADGRTVQITRLPLPQPLPPVGYHPNTASDRLDLLAARYLGDATVFWRICDANNAPAPAGLAARPLIGVPTGPGLS